MPYLKYHVMTCLQSFLTGQDICLGKPLDDTLLQLIHKEVHQLSESLNNHKEQDNLISATLNLLKCEFDRAVVSLQDQQFDTEITCKDLKQKQEMIIEGVEMCWKTSQKLQNLCNRLEAKSAFLQQDLDLLTTTVKSLSHSGELNATVFDAPEQTKWFTGRKKESNILEKCLPLNERKELKMAAICGLGGCGKSTLASHFAWKRKEEYEGGVFWISMEDDRKFENSVNDLALRLGIEASSFDFTLSKLLTRISKQEKPWLMVLDDVDQLNLSEQMHIILSGRWKRQARGHILLTTRRESKEVYSSVDLDPSCCVEVFSFSDEEAKGFLLARCGAATTGKEVELDELVRELGCLPLALEQAGAHIKALQCSIADYLEAYKIQRLQLLSEHPREKPSWEYESKNRLAVHTTWLLNFEYVKKSPQGELASRFLQASAFFAPNEIQEDLINFEVLSTDKICNIPLMKNQVVDILTKFSLFQRRSCKSLGLHRLVQEVMRNKMSIQETVTSMLTAVKLLYHSFKDCPSPDEVLFYITSSEQEQPSAFLTNKSRFFLWSILTAHASELQHHVKTLLYQQDIEREVKAAVFTHETSRVIYENAVHLSAHGHQAEAKESEQFAFSVFDSCPSAKRPISGNDLTELFPLTVPLPQVIQKTVLYSSGPPIEGAKLAGEGSEQNESIDELRLQGNALFKTGCFKEAAEAYTEALEATGRGKRPDPRLLNNRATAYLKLGNFQRCLQDSEEYIKILPSCWKGYTRKALALNGLGLLSSSLCSAAIAFYHNAPCCRHYKAFADTFKDLDGKWEVVDSSLSLQRSLITNQNKCLQGRIILLRPGQYNLRDISAIRDTTIAALGNNADVTLICNEPLLCGKCCFQNIVFSVKTTVTVNADASVEFHKCSFRNLTSQAMVLSVFNGSATFLECNVRDSRGTGIFVQGPNSSAKLVKCEISGNGRKDKAFAYGIRVFKEGRLFVHECRIYGNVRGIWIDEGIMGIPAKGAVITDCEIFDNKYEGIVVGGCPWFPHEFTNVIMRGNKIYHNGTFGVRATFNINSILFEANTVFENLWWGVYVHNNSGGVYKDNEICNNRMGGIRVGYQSPGKPPCVVINNFIHDNCGPAFYEGLRPSEGDSYPKELQRFFMEIPPDAEEIFLSRKVSFPNKVLAEFSPSSNHCVQNDYGDKRLKASIKMHCVFCFQRDSTLKFCKRCMTAAYCGKKCQTLHWQKHQYTCTATGQRNTIEVTFRESIPGISFRKTHPSLKPSGPDYFPPPPRDGSRFIVKIQTFEANEFSGVIDMRGFLSDAQDPEKAIMLLYDRSRHVSLKFSGKPQLFHLIMECGMMGRSMSLTKKLYCWAAFKDATTLRIFTHEFPEVQDW